MAGTVKRHIRSPKEELSFCQPLSGMTFHPRLCGRFSDSEASAMKIIWLARGFCRSGQVFSATEAQSILAFIFTTGIIYNIHRPGVRSENQLCYQKWWLTFISCSLPPVQYPSIRLIGSTKNWFQSAGDMLITPCYFACNAAGIRREGKEKPRRTWHSCAQQNADFSDNGQLATHEY